MSNGASNHPKLDTEIVGIVRDSRHETVRDDAKVTEFQPLQQNDSPANLFLYLRAAMPPEQLLPTVRRTMQHLDPSLALVALRTMNAQIDDSLANERMITLLAISFGLLATLLAGIGIYGVLAFTTAQRTREIGIRIALGSPRLTIVRMVVLDVLRLAGISLAVAPSALVRTHASAAKPATWRLAGRSNDLRHGRPAHYRRRSYRCFDPGSPCRLRQSPLKLFAPNNEDSE